MPKTRTIAFLRGINLASTRRVSMPALHDLCVTGTSRNWKTVTRLLELADE